MAQEGSTTNITPSVAKVGLNLDGATRDIAQGELSWALSAILDGFDGEAVNYSNEPANELCCSIPDGYRVIGKLNITEESKIILWLVNPSTGDSEIGSVQDCIYSKIINALCLNFHIEYPILKAVYKHTNCGIEVYWVDGGRNNARYLQLENLPYKEIEGCVDEASTEIDCNKLTLQSRFSIPRIEVEEALTGGNIKAGAYQFAAQYANALSEAYTSYYSITNEAPAFDNTQPTQNFDFEVNKGFRVNITDIDVTGIYDYINIAVIRTVNNISTAELIGTYQITAPTLSVLYTGQTKTSLNIEDVKQRYEIFDKPNDLTTAQDVLILSGISEEERISYQQIANKISLKWATVRLNGNSHPYADVENAVKYRAYMRDEIYPFEMVVNLTNGYISDGFHIPARVATSFDLDMVVGDDIPKPVDECDTSIPSLPRWQVYNTASKTATLHPDNTDECYEGEWEEGQFAYWESTETYDCNQDIWGELAGRPIRHHKFPDSLITHIHDNEGYIYPIGVRIDPQQIISLINQSSLTEEQKSKIQSVSIFRGDRVNNSSVIAKGLINNVLKYDTNNKIPLVNEGEVYQDPAKQNIKQAYDALASASGEFFASAYAAGIDTSNPFYLDQMALYTKCLNELNSILELDDVYSAGVVERLEVVLSDIDILISRVLGDIEKMYDETAKVLIEVVVTIITLQIEINEDLDTANIVVDDRDKYMYFPNYLFNDVSTNDPFLDGIIYDEDAKERYAFHSPDTHFYQPSISPGVQLKLETAEYGLSSSHMREVEKHSKYQFISATGYITALVAGLGIGFASGTYGLGSVNVFNGTAMFTAYQVFIDILYKTVPHKNYANQINAIGDYSSFVPIPNNGDKIRVTDIATYLSPGMLNVGDKYTVNNFQRESSIYLKTQSPLPYTNENVDVPSDRSKIINGSYNVIRAPISSYYAALKNNLPNQYGQMYSYETVNTGYTVELDSTASTTTIFGGDVFINKFAFKNKIPFFIDNRVGAPDDSDISYNELSNVGKVKYWFSTDVNSTKFSNSVFATMVHHFFIPKMEELYTTGIIFLFAYGIPYFFCESNVNVDLRQAYDQYAGDFYPRVSSGIPDKWLQESYVSINNDNSYWYNKSFSKQNKETYVSHLPSDYDFNSCRIVFPFRAVFSEEEKGINNPSRRNNWRIFKPASKFDFPQNYGKLTSLDGVNDQQVLARFENKTLLYNALLTAPTSAAQVYLGKSLFSRDAPPLDLGNTDNGFVGSQHKFFLKIPYGGVAIDAKRGQIFLINGKQLEELSNEKYKCSQFFEQNLPFSILKQFPKFNADNNFNHIGLHGVYDSRFDRLVITKLDYEAINKNTTYSNGKFYLGSTELSLQDTTYFKNKCFTISFDFDNMRWVSFHPYTPLYYIGDNNKFYQGTLDEIYVHYKQYTKFNNFNGVLSPYSIEYPVAYKYRDELLQSIQDYTIIRQYNDYQEFVQVDDVYFDETILYNSQQCSGVRKLSPKPSSMNTYLKFPVYNTDNINITFTKSNNFYQYNTFWSVVKDKRQPIWKSSLSSPFKELNQDNMNYKKLSYQKAPLMAKDIKVRHTLNSTDEYKFISQLLTQESIESFK